MPYVNFVAGLRYHQRWWIAPSRISKVFDREQPVRRSTIQHATADSRQVVPASPVLAICDGVLSLKKPVLDWKRSNVWLDREVDRDIGPDVKDVNRGFQHRGGHALEHGRHRVQGNEDIANATGSPFKYPHRSYWGATGTCDFFVPHMQNKPTIFPLEKLSYRAQRYIGHLFCWG